MARNHSSVLGVAVSPLNITGLTLKSFCSKKFLGNTAWAKKEFPTAVFRLIMEICIRLGRAVDCGMWLKKYSKTPWMSCSLYPAPLSTFILQLLPAISAFQPSVVSSALKTRSSPGNFWSGPKTIPVGTRKYLMDKEQTIPHSYLSTHSPTVATLPTHRKLLGISCSTRYVLLTLKAVYALPSLRKCQLTT